MSRLRARGMRLLVGRDGGVKARYESSDLAAMFAFIDTMPVRIQEMRTQDAD